MNMKKTIIVAVLALMTSTIVYAQERMSAEDRAAAMAERIKNAADRSASEFKLKDDAKKAFIETYTAYQKEMFATNQFQGLRSDQIGRDEDKKLTDEEATAKIQENFTRQEQQIATMQKRLEVQKKYAEEVKVDVARASVITATAKGVATSKVVLAAALAAVRVEASAAGSNSEVWSKEQGARGKRIPTPRLSSCPLLLAPCSKYPEQTKKKVQSLAALDFFL